MLLSCSFIFPLHPCCFLFYTVVKHKHSCIHKMLSGTYIAFTILQGYIPKAIIPIIYLSCDRF